MNATPQVLTVLNDLLSAAAPDARGALWQLAEPGRELDANLVRLPPGAEVGEHREDVLDVLLVVLAGSGRLAGGPEESLPLTPSTVTWLPRTSRRALSAGPDGLTYLTVHRRRPGLTIKPPPAAYEGEGGEAPCLLDRVCPECGRLSAESAPVFCGACGERFPER
ncbi:hypothetical protein [Streptomyces sp. BE147]|uniref:hypothetical protein n=1 Tax=unclassified Streptomyces TaxID=2593676 RepID=UPI002E776EE0|nr:hypothetical protein [Streptomyces sp. BE147]MEE1736082.1 hypothetical protein [Streptomyces sp. BE147]